MKSIMAFLILIILFSFSVNAVYDYDATKQSSGIVTILEGKTASITFDGVKENVLKVNGVGGKVAYISIDGREFSFDLGSEREVDLTGDGKTDVRITLNNIIDKLVGLRIQKLLEFPVVEAPKEVIVEEAPKEVVIEDAEKELDEDADDALENDKEEAETKEEETKGIESITGSVIGGVSSKWVIGGAIVVIIIIIIFVASRDGNKSEKIYNKATDLHREGQEFHYDGDDETAKELYDKASELREKARNMEGGL